MKKLYFLALLFLSTRLCSQLETPFPGPGTHWNVQEMGDSWGTAYRLFANRDTTYEGTNYHVVDIYLNPNPTIASFYQNYGYYRVDSLQVFFRPSVNMDSEFLIYDFGLNVGDSGNFYTDFFPGNLPGRLVLASIDSILIQGAYYRKFNFGDNAWPDSYYWIEGVGSHSGLIPFQFGVEWIVSLECFYQNNYGFFVDYNHEVHTCWNAGIDEAETFFPDIYPNPARDILYVETDKPNLNYILRDARGQLVLKTSQSEISVSKLTDGIYFLEISDQAGFSTSRKITIQH